MNAQQFIPGLQAQANREAKNAATSQMWTHVTAAVIGAMVLAELNLVYRRHTTVVVEPTLQVEVLP